MMAKITVMLVDDHAVVRAGHRMLLSQYDNIAVMAETARGEEACQIFVTVRPDIVVMDLNLPGIGGLAAIRRICGRDPHARILAFSVHDEPLYVTRALEAGCKGYVTKSSAPEILVEAIIKVAHGATYIDPDIASRMVVQPAAGNGSPAILTTLTAREFDIFHLLVNGSTTREIAEELCLGYKTVANYVTLIKSKLGVNTAAEMTRLAYQYGILKS
ncbi:response regulator transcription factor [Candidatus Methylospira mobilis]|uniref:Response regulator transcription factor n=2 Tax=Candidatus Methylospira mobilis TaxID=1808979 RepID=A0A5Q0BMQ4_9GAMM|nr:response regulator transcription factor [Candidatus Methylospira mobilis]